MAEVSRYKENRKEKEQGAVFWRTLLDIDVDRLTTTEDIQNLINLMIDEGWITGQKIPVTGELDSRTIEMIKRVQRLLIEKGYRVLADGDFGPYTRGALKRLISSIRTEKQKKTEERKKEKIKEAVEETETVETVTDLSLIRPVPLAKTQEGLRGVYVRWVQRNSRLVYFARLLVEIEASSGEQLQDEDVDRFFEFINTRGKTGIAQIIKESIGNILDWMIKNTGYPNNAESFHNLVNALYNLSDYETSRKIVDNAVPPDCGRRDFTILKNVAFRYVYLNTRYGPGVFELLRKKYNIISYSRYDFFTLDSVLAPERDHTRPLALLLVSRGDRNGIMFRDDFKGLLYGLSKTHEIRAYEFASMQDIVEGVKNISSMLKDTIDLLVIISHGEPYVLKVQDWPEIVRISGEEPEWAELRKYLDKDAEVILNSCSTGGAPDGVAQDIADRLGLRVFAPAAKSDAVSYIDFKKDKEGKFRINHVGYGAFAIELKRFYPKKQQ